MNCFILTRKNGRMKLLIILIIFMSLVIWFFSYMKNNDLKQKSTTQEKLINNNNKHNKLIFKGERIVHLDLKGAPPKISYYRYFFQLLTNLGATGVLIEYEDMFPYSGNISALNSYSLKDIETINKLANEMGLKIIPLIQTFGHLEFILKLDEFKHLREAIIYPQVICPSRDESNQVLMKLIDQIIINHPSSSMIHIGSDEVYLLGECNQCFLAMNKNKWTKHDLFLNHVKTIAGYIKDKYPKMRVLMWDDEFRTVPLEDLKKWKVASLVEPVIWEYKRNVSQTLADDMWEMYANIFPRVWIASAFKGATGSDQIATDIKYHLDNHRSWMEVVANYSNRIKFEGIILTGWQRYDHFAVLCELLPVGIPSLAMCLHSIQENISIDILDCQYPYALLNRNIGTPNCQYPGGVILENAILLKQLKEEFDRILHTSHYRGWMTDYNVKNAYSNVLFVEQATEQLDMFKMELVQIQIEMIASMKSIYDDFTITEWCDTYIKPLNDQIEDLWIAKEKLLAKDHWPRRPFLDRKEINH